MEHKKEIKNIAVIKNVVIYNSNHKEDYFTEDGIIVVEYEDNTRNILDIEADSDITNCEHLHAKIIKGKSKVEYIFQDEILNMQ